MENVEKAVEDEVRQEVNHGIKTFKDILYAVTHVRETWNVKSNDPLVVLRFKTCIKTAIAALLTFMFVAIPALRLVVHEQLYAIMQSIILTIIVHQSLQGTLRNSIDMLHGGFVGIITGYITWQVSPNFYVSLGMFFVVTFGIGAYDPALQRPLFMRIAVWDYLVTVFFHVPDQDTVDFLFIFVMHLTTLICAFIPFLLIYPNLSSRQFLREYRVCCHNCLDMFRCITPYMKELTHTIRNDNDRHSLTSSFGCVPSFFDTPPVARATKEARQTFDQSSSSSAAPALSSPSIQRELEIVDTANSPSHTIDVTDVHVEAASSQKLLEVRISHDVKLHEVEQGFHRNLTRLNRVLNESKWEQWNVIRVREYEQLAQLLARCQHKLTALTRASSRGLLPSNLGLNFLQPMVPIYDELLTQLDDNLEKLTVKSDEIGGTDNLDGLVMQMDSQYNECAKNFEINSATVNPTSAFTRMIFILFGTAELGTDISKIAITLRELPEPQHNAATEFLLNAFTEFSFVDFVTNFLKWWASWFIAAPHAVSNFKAYYKSRAWVFPLQLAIGCTIVTFFMKHFTWDLLPVQHWNGLWSCITFEIVILPSMGATIKRSFHRVIGTALGAYVGFAFLIAPSGLPESARIVVLSALLLIFISISSYLHQIPRYSYTGTVSAFTFLLVFDGQFHDLNPDVWYPTMRAIHIVIGLAAVILVSIIIFPQKSYVKFQQLLLKTSMDISNLYGLAVEQTFKVEVDAELRTNVMQLRGKLQSLRVLLKQSKSEVIFCRGAFDTYKKAAGALLLTYNDLFSLHSAACHAFRQDTADLILDPLREPMQQLVARLQQYANLLFDYITKASPPAWPNETIGDAVIYLDEAFLAMRAKLIMEKHYFEVHPDLRKISEIIYNMRDLAKQWTSLEAAIRSTFNKE